MLTCWAPVRTTVSAGSTRRTSATSRAGLIPGLGADADLVELAHLVEQSLRGGKIEAGQSGAAQRARAAEADQTRDPHGDDRAGGLDADHLARTEGLLRRRVGVDHDLVGPRPPTADPVQ
jgi:hypothetical protein